MNPTGLGGQFRIADNDPIYETYLEYLRTLNNSATTRSGSSCSLGEVSCRLSNQCIPTHKWCDQTVDCSDATDESQCSCVDRLKQKSKKKVCDGYIDCPDGADEVGCFGCASSFISCFRNLEEYSDHNQMPFCYSQLQRCDGVEDCFNGKDEEDCSRIVSSIGKHTVGVYR